MEKWRKDMQLAGKEDQLDKPVPIPMTALSLGKSVKLTTDKDEACLSVDRFVGDTAPYVDRLTGERDVAWDEQIIDEDETAKMLEEFVKLADAPTKDFVYFANRYGLLGLCDNHGIPFSHPKNEECFPAFIEPVRFWRKHAVRVRAILQVAANLHWSDQNSDKPSRLGGEEDWKLIEWWNPKDGVLPPSTFASIQDSDDFRVMPKDLQEAKEWLAIYVNETMEWVSLHPFLWWSESSPRIELRGWTPWRYIAAQLLFRVAGGKEGAMCVNCKQLYSVERKPNQNRRNYCPECRDAGVPYRDSKRDQRAKARNRGSN